MRDRFVSGFIGGIIGGIVMNLIDWIGYSMGFYEERLLDWASSVIFGNFPQSLYEVGFAQIIQLLFSGLLGILFAYLILQINSQHYLIKGWLYGVFAWFGVYAVSFALKLPGLARHSLNATVTHFVSASVYGIVLSLVLHRLKESKQIY